MKLPRSFYDRPTLDVARDLLGTVLVHEWRGVRTSGAIVEVEAYIGEDDPACHAAPGPTRRNAPMYGEPGHAYVYLNYGIHWMMNIVTEAKGSPAAVLIRALAPIDGLEAMRRRRGVAAGDHELCRGPGNLTKAMRITLAENGADLLGPRLYLEDRRLEIGEVAWGPRIGINVGMEHPWRAWVSGHPAVSRGSAPRAVRPPTRSPARAGAERRRG